MNRLQPKRLAAKAGGGVELVAASDPRGATPELLTTLEAAAFTGCSKSFLSNARSRGTTGNRTPAPPFVRIGKAVLYVRSDLEAWIASLPRYENVAQASVAEGGASE